MLVVECTVLHMLHDGPWRLKAPGYLLGALAMLPYALSPRDPFQPVDVALLLAGRSVALGVAWAAERSSRSSFAARLVDQTSRKRD